MQIVTAREKYLEMCFPASWYIRHFSRIDRSRRPGNRPHSFPRPLPSKKDDHPYLVPVVPPFLLFQYWNLRRKVRDWWKSSGRMYEVFVQEYLEGERHFPECDDVLAISDGVFVVNSELRSLLEKEIHEKISEKAGVIILRQGVRRRPEVER